MRPMALGVPLLIFRFLLRKLLRSRTAANTEPESPSWVTFLFTGLDDNNGLFATPQA